MLSKSLPKIFFLSLFLNFSWFELNGKTIILFFFIVCEVDDGVIEGEPVEKFAKQYREPEPEKPYREQELPEGFEDGKSNSILWLHI